MEDRFLYLVPGNWFEIRNINKSKVFPYDVATLQQEIIDQVNSNEDKLRFINLQFGSHYTNKKIVDIQFYIDDNKFMKLLDLLENEKRHPIVTFHGTSLDAANSILKDGYIIPGLSNDKSVKVKNGSVYGIGVYSSPFFDKAMYYTRVNNGHVYMLINMVFVGKSTMIAPSKHNIIFKKPINGVYDDGFHTRIVFGLDQIICADSNRVVPIALLKIAVS